MAQYQLPGAYFVGTGQRQAMVPGSGYVLDTTSTGAVTHDTSGALASQGSTLSGAAQRFRQFASSGVLSAQGSAIVGAADHAVPGGVHDTSGVLAGQGSFVVGSAVHYVKHVTSGLLAGDGSALAGVAERIAPAVTHDTSGSLSGAGSSINGQAQNGVVFVDIDGFWERQWKKAAEQSKRKETLEELEEQLEEIEEQIAEVKAAPIPKRPIIVQSAKIPPFDAQIKLIEKLIAQADRIRAEIEEEEDILLLL